MGNIVPLKVRATNEANYWDLFEDDVYVDGKFVGGKTVQVTFACPDDTCEAPMTHVLEYIECGPGEEAGTDECGFVPGVNGGATIPATFAMGRAAGFGGVDYCDSLSDADSDKACGHIRFTADVRSASPRMRLG